MLPLPYGLLAHELIEVLDQERYLPGITWVGKFAEEFPFLDHHSMKKEKDNYESSHQNVLAIASGSIKILMQSFQSV
jgi:hypothetical protein